MTQTTASAERPGDPAASGAEPLRIGVLGAAGITGVALIAPARATGDRLVACAARDPLRAKAFAEEHGIERVAESYAALLADPEIDAIYNPLANGLHGPWNRRALEAGKHVLTEKPSAANAVEAREVAEVASVTGLVFMEGFHYPYHPRWHRVLEILGLGELGDIVTVRAPMAMPDPGREDIRWQWDLAGGATMDLGCYSLSAAQLLGDLCGGPPRIVRAVATPSERDSRIDAAMDVELEFPSGARAFAGASMLAPDFDFSLTIEGTLGSMHLVEFIRPHLDDRITIRTAAGERVEELGRRSSYTHQLEAFAAAVRGGPEPLTGPEFAVTMMDWIDDAYAAAGMPRREPTEVE